MKAHRCVAKVMAALLAASAGVSASAAISGGGASVEDSVMDAGGGARLSGGGFEISGLFGQAVLPTGSTASLRGGGAEVRRGFYDPPRFTLQGPLGYVLTSADGAAALTLAPNAVGRPSFDAALRRDPLSAPLAVDPAKIARANAKMQANNGPLAQVRPADIWELQLLDEGGFFGGTLAQSGQLRLAYQDADADGIVDGTSPPLRVKTLGLWMLDENMEMWVKVPGAQADPAAKTVAAPLGHLSVFAMIGGADSSVSDAYAFPVPFRPHGPNAGTGAGQTGTEAAGITFTNLPSEGTIEIWTLDGRLVRRLDIPPNLAPARLSWDAKTRNGGAAASGVYLWRVVSGGNSKTGRLVIVR